ncbi:MAG: hydantoinase/oxoprolinase family protein [Anaerolineae bacterium]|jgi:N-methylhydantoinase A/oxoprolinase/acetone carboxylase beta subunit
MKIVLGIDTGGTYTDAALVDHETGEVLAGAKALTTRHDLSIGIRRAIQAVLDQRGISSTEVHLVALSTTLATNSIVEGQGRPVGLLLIGYDQDLMRQYKLERELATERVVYLRGGHDVVGEEVEPLDEEGGRDAILAWKDEVESFAVSGFFGVYNPSHELRVKALVEELTDLPVTCGHELTTRLDSVRRATTAALNAQLIPLLWQLIATMRASLDDMGIHAPLMVVKGDGSLVRADWAMQRPIETILSGPAASVVGAWHLAGRRDVWTVDVGGTTTDIAALNDGRPRLNPQGARVGGWRTMVQAADVYTEGLGGDSYVRLNGDKLVIGPQRVIPLCLLAHEHPTVLEKLKLQEQDKKGERIGQFVVAQRWNAQGLSIEKRSLLRSLRSGPRLLTALAKEAPLASQWIRDLEARQVVLRSAFTPTDALHALGRLDLWNAEASRLGAQMLARQGGLAPETLCERVAEGVSDRVSQALVTKILGDEGMLPDWEREPAAKGLLARALGTEPESDLGCQMRLRQPLVAIGAPVEAYMPRAARQLNTDLVIPPHAEVANAVGAVTGSVVQQVRVTIQPLDENEFRLHLPDGVHDFPTLAEAVRYAEEKMTHRAQAMAREAGAHHIEVRVEREDKIAPVRGDRLYLGTQMTFTAVGRPSLAIQ